MPDGNVRKTDDIDYPRVVGWLLDEPSVTINCKESRAVFIYIIILELGSGLSVNVSC